MNNLQNMDMQSQLKTKIWKNDQIATKNIQQITTKDPNS